MNVSTLSFTAMNHLPEQLLTALLSQNVDVETFKKIHEDNSEIVSIRRNIQKHASKSDENFEKVPWCASGFYLKKSLPSLLTRTFTQDVIMFRRHHLCFLSSC